MSNSKRGKRSIIFVICVILGGELFPIAHAIYVSANIITTERIITLITTVIFCYFLYKGFNWARWFLIVVMSSVSLIIATVTLLAPNMNSTINLIMIIIIILHVLSVGLLVFSKDVRGYMKENR